MWWWRGWGRRAREGGSPGTRLSCNATPQTLAHVLSCSCCPKAHPLAREFSIGHESEDEEPSSTDGQGPHTPARTTLSRFLPTSRRLVQFSNGKIAPDGARIVYIDGAFDVFHPGHVKILKVGGRGWLCEERVGICVLMAADGTTP